MTALATWVRLDLRRRTRSLVVLALLVALGRTLWREVADSTPVAYAPPVVVWLLVLIAPVALLIANLLAAWPSNRAASVRVGAVLRTE